MLKRVEKKRGRDLRGAKGTPNTLNAPPPPYRSTSLFFPLHPHASAVFSPSLFPYISPHFTLPAASVHFQHPSFSPVQHIETAPLRRFSQMVTLSPSFNTYTHVSPTLPRCSDALRAVVAVASCMQMSTFVSTALTSKKTHSQTYLYSRNSCKYL